MNEHGRSMLEIVAGLAVVVDMLDQTIGYEETPWAPTLGSFVDLAADHASKALDAAAFAAMGSGASMAELETATGRPLTHPDWFG